MLSFLSATFLLFVARFLLLRPIKKKTRGHSEEYDPITDLMRSINLIWEIYFTPEQRKLLGDDFMYCLERYERSQHAKGVSNLIEKFNDVVRKLKKEGALSRNVRRTRYPSYELTCHILFQIYSRTVARRSHMLNVYQCKKLQITKTMSLTVFL